MSNLKSRKSIERCFFLLVFIGITSSAAVIRLYPHMTEGQKRLVIAAAYAPESYFVERHANSAISIISVTNCCCLVFLFFFAFKWKYDSFEQNMQIRPRTRNGVVGLIILFYAGRFIVVTNILGASGPLSGSGELPSDVHIQIDILLPLFNLNGQLFAMLLIGRALAKTLKMNDG